MSQSSARKTGLAVAGVLSKLWRLIPARLREMLLFGLFVLESRQDDPAEGLKRLFTIQDRLSLTINERAMAYGRGVHPKHELTRYHDFFIAGVGETARVLDLGCGYGAVARSIARARPAADIVGVDLDDGRLAEARAADNPPNLSFLKADVTRDLPGGVFDVVVLSNVLEHIADRVPFLEAVLRSARPDKILIRVPLFERDWQMAMRRAVGADYRSDPDHKIEHTIAEFEAETAAAGLAITQMATLWGEIWAECRPRPDGDQNRRQ